LPITNNLVSQGGRHRSSGSQGGRHRSSGSQGGRHRSSGSQGIGAKS